MIYNETFINILKPVGISEKVASRIGDMIENYCDADSESAKISSLSKLDGYMVALGDTLMCGNMDRLSLLGAVEGYTLKEATRNLKRLVRDFTAF